MSDAELDMTLGFPRKKENKNESGTNIRPEVSRDTTVDSERQKDY